MKKSAVCFTLIILLLCSLFTAVPQRASAVELRADDSKALSEYEGEFVSVVGRVVKTFKAPSGKVRFLNFGANYRHSFSVVIFTGDMKKFADIGEPTEYYLKKNVKVSGIIKIYRGRPEIIVKSPAQLAIIE
jgi:DNA/RNA endonuclease YhcR with UshA esterase domain